MMSRPEDFPRYENSTRDSLLNNAEYSQLRQTSSQQGHIELRSFESVSRVSTPSTGNATKKPESGVPTAMPRPVPAPRGLGRFGWWWELWAATLGLSCTIAIIAVLIAMDNKPLHDWKMSFLQPNTLVAIFSTIARSALVVVLAEGISQLKWAYFEKKSQLSNFQTFDTASRGPWGSLLLLWKMRGRALLATLGALLIILMLGFEPFAQQLIQFSSQNSILSESNSTAGYSHAWSDGQTLDRASGNSTSKNTYKFLAMAAPGALLNMPLDLSSDTYCQTTDCRLPSFDSLAVCSQCQSETITNDQLNCKYGFGPETANLTSFPKEDSKIFSKHSEFVDFLHATSSNASSSGKLQIYCEKKRDGFPPLKILVNSLSHARGKDDFASSTLHTMLNNQKIWNADSLPQVGAQDDEYHPESFRFCLFWDPGWVPGQSTDDEYTFLDVNPEDNESEDLPTKDSFDPTSLLNSTCFTSSTNLQAYDLDTVGQINGTISYCQLDLCMQKYSNYQLTNGREQSNPRKVPLKLDKIDESGDDEADYYDYRYTAEGTPITVTVNQEMMFIPGSSRITLGALFRGLLVESPYSYDSFIDSGDWDALFTRFADILNKLIRSPLNPLASNVTLNAYGPVTYIHVNWPWMVVPILLAIFSIVFLFLTIFQSRHKRYLFKSSVLAILSTKGESWDDSLIGRDANNKVNYINLEREAEGLQAVFTQDEKGILRMEKDR